MKKIILILSMLACNALSYGQVNSVAADSFKVYGNCSQCKERIEKASMKINGVTEAQWNETSQVLHLKYDSSKVKLQQIHEAIAKAGHDTDKMRAKDKAYNSLPSCCLYERNAGLSANEPIETVRFRITGMSCAEGCAKGIEGALYKMKGVKSSEVNFNTLIATVIFDNRKVSREDLKKTIEAFDPGEKGEHQYHAEEIK